MADETELLRIGDLAQRTNKTVRALHLYEELGLLCPASRSRGGFRLYDTDNIARIEYIDRMKRLGYSLAEIGELVRGFSGGLSPREAMAAIEQSYRSRLTEVRASLDELQVLKAELESSLTFLEGCRSCGKAHSEENHACEGCPRASEVPDELPLITGLASH